MLGWKLHSQVGEGGERERAAGGGGEERDKRGRGRERGSNCQHDPVLTTQPASSPTHRPVYLPTPSWQLVGRDDPHRLQLQLESETPVPLAPPAATPSGVTVVSAVAPPAATPSGVTADTVIATLPTTAVKREDALGEASSVDEAISPQSTAEFRVCTGGRDQYQWTTRINASTPPPPRGQPPHAHHQPNSPPYHGLNAHRNLTPS